MSEPKAVKEDPRFVSTTGKPELLALLSGHTASVTNEPEGTPLHPRFHRIAVLSGVVPLAMAESFVAAQEAERNETGGVDKQTLIENAIDDMVKIADSNPAKQAELFTNDGRPDARAIATRIGMPVSASERDAAWDKIVAEGES